MPDGLSFVLTAGPAAAMNELSRTLIERRYAACVSRMPVQSMYRWNDAITDEFELLILIKSPTQNVGAVTSTIAQLHPYEVPEIVTLHAADVAQAYMAWIVRTTSTQQSIGHDPGGL